MQTMKSSPEATNSGSGSGERQEREERGPLHPQPWRLPPHRWVGGDLTPASGLQSSATKRGGPRKVDCFGIREETSWFGHCG